MVMYMTEPFVMEVGRPLMSKNRMVQNEVQLFPTLMHPTAFEPLNSAVGAQSLGEMY